MFCFNQRKYQQALVLKKKYAILIDPRCVKNMQFGNIWTLSYMQFIKRIRSEGYECKVGSTLHLMERLTII